jgi:hypothetical protein
MHAFTRLTSLVLFVLSLSFLVCARPTSIVSDCTGLAVRDVSTDKLVSLMVDLRAKVEASCKVLGRLNSFSADRSEV